MPEKTFTEKNKIFLYVGPGASNVSLLHTKYTLESLLDSHYDIEEMTPLQIKQGTWEEKAVLFIMPGGSDLFYLKNLSPHGNDKIRKYVENGGTYLGFCAGAYYAGERVNFAMNTPLEIVGERELKFFPGTVEGPTLAAYDEHSYSGCGIAHLHWNAGSPFAKSSQFYAFYNGGGCFMDAQAKPNTVVLASYKTAFGLKPAIIEISVGKGKAMLSGAHWEYVPSLLDPKDPYLKDIIPRLQGTNPQTLELSRHLFERLGLKLAKYPQ